MTIGLFTVAIFRPFLAHFDLIFNLIFQKWTSKWTERWLFLKNSLPSLLQKCSFSPSFFHPIFVVLSNSALLPISLAHQPPSSTTTSLPAIATLAPPHSCEWLQMSPSWWRRFLSQWQLSLTSDGQHHDCYNFKLLSDNRLYSCSVLGKLSIVNSRCTWF